MIHLEPIPESDFTDYWNYSVKSWKKDMMKAGLLGADTTFEEADAQVRKFIPEGMKTPGHFFFYVYSDQEKVGKIWLELRAGRANEAYIWDLFLEKDFRGKGYGKETMKRIEEFARQNGAPRISLNVFPFNDIARNLYRKSGYRDAAITMIKDL